MENAQAEFWPLALQSLSQLNATTSQSQSLQENTVIAIAIAKSFQGGFDRPSFWMRPDVCARSTFNKWKKYDPIFPIVLDEVCTLAKEWRSTYATQALQDALEIIQVNSSAAAIEMVNLALNGEEENTRRHASADILTRASMITAPKASAKVESDITVETAVSGDRLAELIPTVENELAKWRKQRTNGDK